MIRVRAHAIAGRRILLVEDEFFIADDMAEALEELGAVVVGPAPSVAAALEHIRRHQHLDGAVLDINLGGETVFPVAEVLHDAHVPMVFTTGYDRAHIPPRFASIPHCIKPIAPEAVVAALVG